MSFVAHMFGRSERSRSVIAAGTTLRGSVEGAEELMVAGTIIGDVQATAVTVSAEGRVEGNITADVLMVAGSVTGTCTVEALAVTDSGRLEGEALCEKLEVAPGAVIEARCQTRPATSSVSVQKSPSEKAERPRVLGVA